MNRRTSKISIQLLALVILIIFACKNENQQTNPNKTNNSKPEEFIKDNQSQEESNYITKDSIFYLMKFEEMEFDSLGQFSIADKKYNVLDVTKVRLGIDSKEDWKKEKFPINVFKFKNLEYLWIGMRGFREIPIGIGDMKKLKHLDLQHGNIRKLPTDFYKLENLETLTLLFSNINELPEKFENLENLKDLHLGCTKIETIPNQITKMKGLKSLMISHDDECQGKRIIFTKDDELKIRTILNSTKVGIGRDKPIE